jgi:hypothetical protein
LKELEQENSKLKRLVAELSLAKLLRLLGKWLTYSLQRELAINGYKWIFLDIGYESGENG